MSCKHGNWPDCEECEELNALCREISEQQAEIERLTKERDAEGKLREQVANDLASVLVRIAAAERDAEGKLEPSAFDSLPDDYETGDY